jgi:hypothetical protein
LQRYDVAAPTAEEASDDERAENRRDKKDESGIDQRSRSQSLHGFAWLDRRQGRAVVIPVQDVEGKGDVNEHEAQGAPARPAGGAHGALGLAGWRAAEVRLRHVVSPVTWDGSQPLYHLRPARDSKHAAEISDAAVSNNVGETNIISSCHHDQLKLCGHNA